MSAQRGVTAEELVRSLRRRQAALPSGIGTFVVFEACEVMLASGPAKLSLQTLSITEEGAVSVAAESADEEGAARCLHRVLTGLLVAAGPPPTPALLRLAEYGPLEGRWTLDQMRDDLEAALVPLNRTASRRVLARLVRETARGASTSARAEPAPSFDDLDHELNSLLGLDEAPRPRSHGVQPVEVAATLVGQRPASAVSPAPRRDETEREDVASVANVQDDVPRPQLSAVSSAAIEPFVDDRVAMHGPPPASLRSLEALSERPRSGSGFGPGTLWGTALVLIALGLAAAVFVLRPETLARLQGRDVQAEPAKPRVVPLSLGGDLTVRVTNERAQILRFVGRGPVTVPNLPLGVAHEFVAVPDGSEGALPTRVLVPAGAEWESAPEGPRYEVAMQASASETAGASLDLGDTLLPQDVGVPRAQLGSVRIVTTPRGAKVYQLIGFAPEAKIQGLSLDHDEELLIWKRGHEAVSRLVTAAEFVAPNAGSQGPKQALLEVVLSPLRKRAQ